MIGTAVGEILQIGKRVILTLTKGLVVIAIVPITTIKGIIHPIVILKEVIPPRERTVDVTILEIVEMAIVIEVAMFVSLITNRIITLMIEISVEITLEIYRSNPPWPTVP